MSDVKMKLQLTRGQFMKSYRQKMGVNPWNEPRLLRNGRGLVDTGHVVLVVRNTRADVDAAIRARVGSAINATLQGENT